MLWTRGNAVHTNPPYFKLNVKGKIRTTLGVLLFSSPFSRHFYCSIKDIGNCWSRAGQDSLQSMECAQKTFITQTLSCCYNRRTIHQNDTRLKCTGGHGNGSCGLLCVSLLLWRPAFVQCLRSTRVDTVYSCHNSAFCE